MRKKRSSAPSRTYADIVFDVPLKDVDELAQELADLEQTRQNTKLVMIASESMCPRPVREALTSTFTNLYAEGYPRTKMLLEEQCVLDNVERQVMLHRRYQDRRYYKGCDYVNMVEAIAQKRLAELFATKNVPVDHIFTNVQSHSGASANNAIYEAFLKPGDSVMGMSLASGGHLTHGSKVNRSGKHYNIVSYTVDVEDGKLNYDGLRELAQWHKPKMIIAGYSAYPWDVDWQRLRQIADEVGNCILLADVSHTAGLIAGGVMSNPIEHAHVVMFTTQKTMCGPRGAVILSTDPEISRKIDSSVFPGEQSGAFFNNILAKAVCFEIAKTPEFRELQRRIVRNAQALGAELKRLGLTIAYGGTESHMVLVNLRPLAKGGFALTGETVSRILDLCGITCNKNSIAGDENAIHPSAVRFGTTWVTQKGLGEADMVRIARVLHSVITQIVPFDYIGGNRNVARGKIRFEVIEKARRDVCRIVDGMAKEGGELDLDFPHYCSPTPRETRVTPLYESYKALGARFAKADGWTVPKEVSGKDKEVRAARKGSVVLDTSDVPAFEVVGERSVDFLQGCLTRDLYSLGVHEGMEALMLSPKGDVMTCVNVFRLEDTRDCGPRFLLTNDTGIEKEIRDWLYALSDGYIRFDPDVFMKIEGPVLVEDRFRSDDTLASIDVIGRDARRAVERVAGRLPRKSSWIKDVKVGGRYAQLLKMNENGGTDRFRLNGPEAVVRKALDRLLSSKGASVPVPGGMLARERLCVLGGVGDGTIDGKRLLRRRSELFEMWKPYFIGADALEAKERVHDVVLPKVKPRPLRKSYLADAIRERHPDVTLQQFAGWEMPVMFESIRGEHKAVREAVGLFDLSHMGVLEISGDYAARFLDIVTSNYVRSLMPGQSHYSYVLDPSGGVLDDVFVYRLAEDRFILVANAVNAEKIEEWLRLVNRRKVPLTLGGRSVRVEGEVRIRNLKEPASGSDRKMIIAVQGPKSLALLSEVVGKNAQALSRMRKFEIGEFSIKGARCLISRTGYTGEEFGYEVFVHPAKAPEVWNLLLQAGERHGARPAGLGARDSTRAEAGLPLWGNELAGHDRISPVEAGYGSFVRLHKPFFIGRDAMVREALNRNREVVRFKIDRRGARMARRGNIVATKRGEVIGEVTSNIVAGTAQVGLALVERGRVGEDDDIQVGLSHTFTEEQLGIVRKNRRLEGEIQIEQGHVLPRFPPRENGTTTWH